MEISVIIPVFNKIEIIQYCILLNINHAKKPCHWLIIDNNSDEKTKIGLLELKNKAEEKKHIFDIITESKNTGVAKAWNKGLSFVKTNFVCVLNNDCVMMPNWDEELLKVAQKNKFDIFSPFVLETHILKNYTLENFLNGQKNYEFYVSKNKKRIRNGTFGGVIFFGKTSTFNNLNGFDERFWLSLEDFDFLETAIQKGMKVGITGSVLAFHYVSVTRKEIKYDFSKNQAIFEEKWKWNFEKNENSFINKLIKSYNKILLKRFNKLGSLNPFMP